ncbi:MAG TPA: SoxR reducing system RseC family protein, partial [Methylophilus sp.]
AQVGDSVIVGIEEKSLLISALLLYIVPLVTMMIAAILALQWSGTDLGAMLGAVLGLVIGLLWVKGYTASSRYFLLQQPEILRLANDTLELKIAKR